MPNKAMLALAALVVTALGVGAIAEVASADEGGGWRGRHGGMMRNFTERYDTNKDGKVSQEEIDANRTEWFGKFDADKNGTLNLKEFEVLWLEAHRKEMVREFQKLDPNGDAALTLDEYKEPLSRFVANRDRNGDGVISKEDRRQGGKERWRRDRDHDDDKDDSQEK
ncbi:EF-hand domain-containing protein [Aestuariivirga sp. YIM B02566]|uniref:EF-hand domain-containing protein n=1 Tax=Taklimakanibacter albus TaxID=2800327 RepID=A0ACC5QY85_9HYPH|nr:EF-hand domain-containing protein [Aestuariivirga sp. YIM B02566]MBK1865312.1 EF-hand domain-containing protein [Aestuariivirga sp. YIM B02566]